MGDCIGGYVYLNDNYTEVLDEPRFVDHGEVTTQTLTNINAKILEINSKSGLYPLYVAYSIYRKRISNYSDEEKTKKIQEELWHQTLRENIYVICKTEMAKLITKRTLLGYKAGKINAHYFEDLVNQFKNKTSHVIKKITTKGTWHKGEIGYMKFDAIVGNPPYQVMDGGGNGVGATSIYQLFVQTAKKMNSAIISMITPSRWFSGGKGLNEFRDEMLNDKRLKCIVDFQDSRDCFPNVDIAGGVSYFLIDRINHSHCLIRHYESGHWDESSRVLNDFPILIRDSVSYSIICKIKKTSKFMNEVVSSRKPFGIESSEPLIERGEYLYFCKDGWGMIDKRKVLRGFNLISKNKVVISKTASEHAGQKDSFGKKKVLSKIEIMPQNSVCSETYLVVFASDNDEEVQNVKNYLSTKFVRFLLSCVASTQNLTKESFMFVPVQDFSKSFSDQELFRKYDLSQEEISFIENMIKPMA
jgi:hypothetical protein